MKRVTGIGGFFFKAKDPVSLRAWYQKHLGIDVQAWGGVAFTWADADGNPTTGTTIWNVADAEGDYFAPSSSTFMVNYRVADLPALIQVLCAEGCNVIDKTEESEYGKFGWVMDAEGNKVELLDPPPGKFPGPAQAPVIAKTLAGGRRGGVFTPVGLNIGTLFHTSTTAVGLGGAQSSACL